MRQFEDVYRKLMAFLTGGSLAICFTVVLASSLSRYLLNMPFQWSEELAKFAMIYGTGFGMTLAYLSATQVRFAVVLHFIPDRLKPHLELVCDSAALVLGFVLTVSGYMFMMKRGGIQAPGLNIQMYYPQASIMISGGCLLIGAAIRIVGFRATGKAPAVEGGKQ